MAVRRQTSWGPGAGEGQSRGVLSFRGCEVVAMESGMPRGWVSN